MNREDIICMAREADFKANVNEPYNVTNEWVFRFAALVASAERERFADECIDLVASYGGPVDLEAAIRARGSHD